MQKKFEDKMDIVDALEDGKAKLIFLAHAYSSIHNDKDMIPGEQIVHGMYIMLSEMAEQIGAVSDEIQHNVYEVKEVKTRKVSNAG